MHKDASCAKIVRLPIYRSEDPMQDKAARVFAAAYGDRFFRRGEGPFTVDQVVRAKRR